MRRPPPGRAAAGSSKDSAASDAADGVSIGNLDRRIPDAGTADEVARLTQAFNALLERLERSVLNIKRFTADASHEFRMPLTLMKCEVEALLRDAEKGAALEESFERLLLEIHHLNGLCDSLLFLTRADAGAVHLTPEPIDLSALCQELLEDVEALAEPAGIRVENAIRSAQQATRRAEGHAWHDDDLDEDHKRQQAQSMGRGIGI